MKFAFRLEKALHFIRLKETMKRLEVSALQQRVGFLERRRQELDLTTRDLLARSATLQPQYAGYQTMKITLNTRESTRLERIEQEERRGLETCRAELSRILMKKRALESLRERRLEEFKLEQGRREQKRIDEAFSNTALSKTFRD